MPKYVHSKGGTTVKLDMPDFSQATKDLGIDQYGKVQAFATKRAAMRMDKYVPMRTGVLKGTADYTSVPTQVTYNTPYARYQYFGRVMAGDPREATETLLVYGNTPGGAQRGSHWDEKMIANEEDEWVKEVQEYSDKLKAK